MTTFLTQLGYEAWILHALIWLPLVGMGVVLALPEERAKTVAFGWSLGLFVLSVGLWWAYTPGSADMQMVSSTPWIGMWGIHYALGVDGISLFMILLTTLTTIGGMLPLALFGGPMWAGMAWAVIVGLAVSTALTLFVVPTLFGLLVERFGVKA